MGQFHDEGQQGIIPTAVLDDSGAPSTVYTVSGHATLFNPRTWEKRCNAEQARLAHTTCCWAYMLLVVLLVVELGIGS